MATKLFLKWSAEVVVVLSVNIAKTVKKVINCPMERSSADSNFFLVSAPHVRYCETEMVLRVDNLCKDNIYQQ